MSEFLYPEEPRIRWESADIDKLLLWATELGMSDMKLFSGGLAWMRLHGVWRPVTKRAITSDELLAALERLTKNHSVAAMIKSGQKDYDFAHEIEEIRGVRKRYRGNATPIADGYATGVSIVFRVIPSVPPHLDVLNVEPEIVEHAFPGNGLVLATGVMGSGKTTLLGAFFDEIIRVRGGRNVQTYESPIEFDLSAIPGPRGPVTQSAIPEHLGSFLSAVRNSTRTAPDVVLIGESRDPETLRGMIESAEIGVAAYSTVHTRSVPETLSRIINVFPSGERGQVTATLLSSLRLIISQRLLPRVGGGRIALREYLAFTPEIRETLLNTAPERLIQETEILLVSHGQRIQEAARTLYDAGQIAREEYVAVMAERKHQQQGQEEREDAA
jgi:defect-in-organelle-trafficking protein DotB